MGFGTAILFMFVLGALLFGPRQLTTILGHVARLKAQFEKAARDFKSQAEAELNSGYGSTETSSVPELAEDQ